MTRELDHLAKVRVAGSNPVVRSRNVQVRGVRPERPNGSFLCVEPAWKARYPLQTSMG